MAYSGTYRYPMAMIKEVKKEAAAAPHVSNNGKVIPDWAQIVSILANNGWAPEIKQVPATVINYGNFNQVPYISFRCASSGYEINIFGDLNNPAAVEIGAMNYLKDDGQAKKQLRQFHLLRAGECRRPENGPRPELEPEGRAAKREPVV